MKSYSPALQNLLMKMINSDPDRRPNASQIAFLQNMDDNNFQKQKKRRLSLWIIYIDTICILQYILLLLVRVIFDFIISYIWLKATKHQHDHRNKTKKSTELKSNSYS